MKTLMTLMMIVGSMNVMAYSKKAEYSFAEGTICSDRSIGKGSTETNEPAVESETSEAITN